jgi:L-ribulose-5-phosphate 3-epimerase
MNGARSNRRCFVGIEYEGGRLSEPEGIKATKKLLESLRGS